MTRTTPFDEIFFDAFIKNKIEYLTSEITNRGENILNIDTETFARNLSKKYYIEPLQFDFEKIDKRLDNIEIQGYQFPNAGMRDVYSNKYYPIEVARYEIPYQGDTDLLQIKMQYPIMSMVFSIDYNKNSIIVTMTTYGPLTDNDIALKKIKTEFGRIKNIFEQMQQNLNQQVNQYNEELPKLIDRIIKKEIDTYKRRKASEDKL